MYLEQKKVKENSQVSIFLSLRKNNMKKIYKTQFAERKYFFI